MIADAIHERLATAGFKTRVVHRDISKDEQRYKT